jgi:ribosomal protein S18 acetylase RimI-like enzyme
VVVGTILRSIPICTILGTGSFLPSRSRAPRRLKILSFILRRRRAKNAPRRALPIVLLVPHAIMALNALGVMESIGINVQFHRMIERVRVAEVAGSVAGLPAVMPCAGFTYLLELYVTKEHRRHGVARALVERVIEDARIAGQVRLHVHPDNDARRRSMPLAGLSRSTAAI